MKPLIRSLFLAMWASILWAPVALAGGWAGKQTYTSFDGKTYQMRVYNGKHVALLIQEKHLNSTDWLEIDEGYGAGKWPGFKDEYLEFLVGKIDEGYEFYRELYGYEPAENPGAPNNLLRIAVPDETCGAGCGLIGMKGIEIGPHYLESSIYGARDRKVQQTIFWHELGRNFGIGYNDFGIKYVLVDRLKVPTFMGWEYGVSYPQFELNDTYLISRYYLADFKANFEGYATPPYKAPTIPDRLTSQALYNTNSSSLRAAMSNQYYLENGFEAYKDMVRESDAYNLDQTQLGSMTGLVTFMTEKNQHGLDYSFWQKSRNWKIRARINSGPQNIVLSQSVGKLGDLLLLGRDDDYVQVNTAGQFRIDAGDGYDTVKLPFARSSVIYEKQTRWKQIIITASSKIVLDFVEQVEFSDGQTIKVKKPENSMFPWLKEIKVGTYKIGTGNKPAVRLSFTEPLSFKMSYDWGINFYPWIVALKTEDGRVIKTYDVNSSDFVTKGTDVYFVLPNNLKQSGSSKFTLQTDYYYMFEAVDADSNRLSRDLLWKGFMIPKEYNFSIRSIGG